MHRPLRVLAVTTWGTACGIAEYARLLSEHIDTARVAIMPAPQLLDPFHPDRPLPNDFDVLWLNYHAGLHSRWTEPVVAAALERKPVVVTYHDTYDGTVSPNSDRVKWMANNVDALIVHEPTTDLTTVDLHYIRQGIPRPRQPIQIAPSDLAFPGQPILGTFGFDFPWKNFTRLAEVTAELGWAFMVVSNNLTIDRIAELRAINPNLLPVAAFRGANEVISLLGGCTATAFMYECHNTGTSGAIRLGIAALKQVIALRGCRQFRDLEQEYPALGWCENWEHLKKAIRYGVNFHGQPDGECVYIVTRDAWTVQAARYADIFEQVATRRSHAAPAQ